MKELEGWVIDMHTEMVPSSIFVLLSTIPILIYLGLLFFVIYFFVKLIRFMNEKTKLDRARNEKLDALIKAINREEKEW